MARSTGGGMTVEGPDVPQARRPALPARARRSPARDTEIVVRDRTGEQIGRLVAEHQLVISELTPVGASLEDIFFELTGSTGGPS